MPLKQRFGNVSALKREIFSRIPLPPNPTSRSPGSPHPAPDGSSLAPNPRPHPAHGINRNSPLLTLAISTDRLSVRAVIINDASPLPSTPPSFPNHRPIVLLTNGRPRKTHYVGTTFTAGATAKRLIKLLSKSFEFVYLDLYGISHSPQHFDQLLYNRYNRLKLMYELSIL